jgi:hypothetical protein
MGRLEQLSIGAMDKKRDFCQDRRFHRGNFLELLLRKSRKFVTKIGSISARVYYPNPLLPQQTEALLRQRL